MILKTSLTITFSWLVAFGFCQTPPPKYYELADKADVALKAKKYPKAAQLYSDAFKSNGGKGTFEDRYNAACCWSMSGEADSAFSQLDKISQVARWSSKVYEPVLADPDFKPLHKDPRWNPLLETLRQNKEKAEINLNRPLAAKLDSINGKIKTFVFRRKK